MESLTDFARSSRFREFVLEQLPVIDELLSEENVPLSDRPMQGSWHFVQMCILDKDGCAPENFLEEEWFGSVFEIAWDWFKVKYGAEALASKDNNFVGVLMLFGALYRLNLPTFPTTKGKEKGTVTIFFARTLLAHEDPVAWLKPRIPVDRLSDFEFAMVKEQAISLANKLRRINWGISFATTGSDALGRMQDHILGHIAKAAEDIIENRHGSSVWECHMAMELALKLYLSQKTVGSIPHTHDLKKLLSVCNSQSLLIPNHVDVNHLPSHADAISHRYGEMNLPSLTELHANYQLSLELVAIVADQLEHIKKVNSSYLIKALPWHPSRK